MTEKELDDDDDNYGDNGDGGDDGDGDDDGGVG